MDYIRRDVERQVNTALANRKVLFILGARQVGKTTLVEKVISKYSGSVLYNLDLTVDQARLESAASLSPQEALASLGSSKVIALDEAHRFPQVGSIVKGWYDSKVAVKVILLGSSSLNLLNNSAESLLGRNEKIYLTPLFFSERLQTQDWFNVSVKTASTKKIYSKQVYALLMESLVFGLYPEAVTTTDKENYLTTVVSDLLLIDLLQTDVVRSPETIKKLLLLLSYQIGSEVSVNELALNLGVSRQTVERYLDLLERTFIIFRLPSYSTNPRKELTKSAKIYFWDTGIRNALQQEFVVSDKRSDIGALWENWIIAEFMKKNISLNLHRQLYFWRTRDGSEVDLVIKDKGIIKAYEIKWNNTKSVARGAFTKLYNVKPEVVNKDNFIDYIL